MKHETWNYSRLEQMLIQFLLYMVRIEGYRG